MYMLFGKMDNQTSRIVEISFWLSMHFAKNLEIFIFLNDCESFFLGGAKLCEDRKDIKGPRRSLDGLGDCLTANVVSNS